MAGVAGSDFSFGSSGGADPARPGGAGHVAMAVVL